LIATLVLLTPRGALLALVGLVPLAALWLAARREDHARAILGLGPPEHTRRWRAPLAVAAVAGLLGLAATQPVLRSTSAVETRTDAQVLFVIDSSRSMLAARTPGGRTRIARAREETLRLRDELVGVPAGVATLTDHVLPDLLPVPDRGVFDETVREAAQVGNPPPATAAVTATSLGALGAVGTQSFFPPSAKHRVAVVLTDGETGPFDVSKTAAELRGVTPIFVHVWRGDERVFDPGGTAESAYHPDPSSAETLASLAQAAGGKVFGEGQTSAVAAAARDALGHGPTRPEGSAASTTALAPYVALAALIPLLLLLGADRPAVPLPRRRQQVRHGNTVSVQSAASPGP